MPDNNKSSLEKANAAFARGDNEGFLSFCTEDTEWRYFGDENLKGKDDVRRYFEASEEPPNFTVTDLIAEGDFVTALGEITTKDEDGKMVHQSCGDVCRFLQRTRPLRPGCNRGFPRAKSPVTAGLGGSAATPLTHEQF